MLTKNDNRINVLPSACFGRRALLKSSLEACEPAASRSQAAH
jgi:hypothetical protein